MDALRIAVISMLDTVDPSPAAGRDEGAAAAWRPSASLRIAGEPIARHQLEIALAAGARRLLLLGDAADDKVTAIIGAARHAGIEARILADAPALCAEVTAADELLIFADSLMADSDTALDHLQGQGIAVLPVEEGLAAGFERIDAEHAWAGAMIVPGSHAERLRELPRDCDIASSLLRIGMMARVPLRHVDAAALADGRWAIIRNDAAAQAAERQRLERSIVEASGTTPGPRIAGFAARRLGGRLLEQDHGDLLVGGMALLCAGAALAATGFQISPLAFLFAALCWMVMRGQRVLRAVRRQGRVNRSARDAGPVLFLAYDAMLVVLIAVNGAPGRAEPAAWFAGLMVIALLRIGAVQFPLTRIRPWLEDRPLLCLLLAISAIVGGSIPLSMLLAGVLALGWMGLTFQTGTPRTKLTRL